MQLLKSKRFIIGIALLGIMIAVRFSGISSYFEIADLQALSTRMSIFVENNYLVSILAYIVFYATIVILCLPAAMLSTLAGGFLFGMLPGTLYANIGATLGATISFLMVRYLIGTQLQEQYKGRLAGFNEAMEEDGTMYLLAIHFIAVIPFFVINVLAGLTNVSLWTFVWTTSLGIIPGSMVYAFTGQQLHTIRSVRDIFSGNVLMAFTLLALLSILPIIVRRLRRT